MQDRIKYLFCLGVAHSSAARRARRKTHLNFVRFAQAFEQF